LIDVQTLRAAGLTDKQILSVVEADQSKEKELLAARRERDRIRKREERFAARSQIPQQNQHARPKCPADTLDNLDSTPTPSSPSPVPLLLSPTPPCNNPLPPNPIIPDPKKEIAATAEKALAVGVSEPAEQPKRKAGKCLPADWSPNETHYAEGQLRAHSRQTIDSFATDMRLWADANSNRAVARKANWDLTFLGWIRRQTSASMAGNSARRTTKDAADDLIAKLQEFHIAPSDSRVESETFIGLLPPRQRH
jgi:hypothetical protein